MPSSCHKHAIVTPTFVAKTESSVVIFTEERHYEFEPNFQQQQQQQQRHEHGSDMRAAARQKSDSISKR